MGPGRIICIPDYGGIISLELGVTREGGTPPCLRLGGGAVGVGRTSDSARAPHVRDTVGRLGAKHLGRTSDTRTGSTSDARPPRRPRHVGRTSDSRARGGVWSASDARAQRSDDPAQAALQRHVRPPCGEHRGVVPAWRYFGHTPRRAHFRRTSCAPSPDGQ